MIKLLIVGFLVFAPLSHVLAQQTCDPKSEELASQVISQVKTLTQLRAFYKKYEYCVDDADVGEGYTEAVSKVLDHDWKSVMDARSLDLETETAIKRGIGEAWEQNIAKRILQRAKHDCSPAGRTICDSIFENERRAEKIREQHK